MFLLVNLVSTIMRHCSEPSHNVRKTQIYLLLRLTRVDRCDALMSSASISEGAGSPTWHAEIFLALSQECELVRIDSKLDAARKSMPCQLLWR